MQGILPAGHLPGDRRPGGLQKPAPRADGLTVDSITNSVERLLDAAGISLRGQDSGGERESQKEKDELKKVLTENLRLKEELARKRLKISRMGSNDSVKDDHLPAAARGRSGELGRARVGPGGKSTDSPSPDATMDELRALRAKWEGQITGSFSRANLSEKSTEDASSGELSDLGGPRGTSGEVATKTWCGSKKKAASSAFEKGQMPAQVRESVSPDATFLGAAAAQRGRKAEEEQGKRDPEAVSTNLSVGFDKIRTIVQAIEKAPKCIKEVLLLEEVIPRREVFSRGKYR